MQHQKTHLDDLIISDICIKYLCIVMFIYKQSKPPRMQNINNSTDKNIYEEFTEEEAKDHIKCMNKSNARKSRINIIQYQED